MANYPTSLPSSTPADHAEVLGEVIAIATELGTDPSGSYATVKARLDAEAVPPVRPIGVGEWLGPLGVDANGTTLITATGRSYAVPFYVPEAMSVDQMAVEVTTAAATAVVNLYLYTWDATNKQPGGRVGAGSIGTIDTSATGIVTTTLSAAQALAAGWHVWVIEVTVAAPRFRLGVVLDSSRWPADRDRPAIGAFGAYMVFTSPPPDPWTAGSLPNQDVVLTSCRRSA